jgi:hypothetical protein
MAALVQKMEKIDKALDKIDKDLAKASSSLCFALQ